MNNEAFRSLVNQNRKSTKEIAREAVENEFRKRKRRPDDQGYGSDSDSDGEAKKPKGWSDKSVNQERGEITKGKKDKKPEYRDRARERREGKVVAEFALPDVGPHDGPVTAQDRKRQAELSKYLGGDEEHTHLVKGLDRVLAQKVRREEMGIKEDEFDELVESAFEKRGAEVSSGGLHSIKPKTDLGRSVLKYLRQKESNNTKDSTNLKVNHALQKSLRRSILTFSLDSDVRKRRQAWDAPQLSIQAFTNEHVTQKKATPLDRQLITTISNKLKGHLLRAKHGNVGVSKDVHQSAQEVDDRNKNEVNEQNEIDKSVKRTAKSAQDSDSDDDIFQNAGNYIPPSATATTTSETDKEKEKTNGNAAESSGVESSNQKKKSIFENLILTSTESIIPEHKVQIHTHQSEGKNVINRDIIGASSDDQTSQMKRRGPQTAAMEGYSMSNYDGGYGEEMDVDFGNFDEDTRKKKKEETNDGEKKVEEEENDF